MITSYIHVIVCPMYSYGESDVAMIRYGGESDVAMAGHSDVRLDYSPDHGPRSEAVSVTGMELLLKPDQYCQEQ